MKARYFFLLAATMLLAGCNKDMLETPVEQEEVQEVKTVLSVGIDNPETKTYLNKDGSVYHVYWSNGDKIAVNGVASNELTGLADNTASTSFTFEAVLSTPYYVLYPAGIYADDTHVTLPAVQTYKAGGIADGMFPMAGYTADGSSVTMSHLCSIVKISVKRAAVDADTDNIVAVRFKGRNSEKVNGEFEIAYNPAALTAAFGSGSELEVRVLQNLATSTSDAIVYYLVVPARTYSNGFDIIVQDVSGHIMTKSKTASWTAEPGKLYSMPEFEFVPTETELGIVINNAQDLIDFATAYNNKEYVDDLVATVNADITFDATSSAAFNATGGIGMKIAAGDAEDYYFNGVFEGGNHYICGLEGTVPLFTATGDNGIVQNLKLASTCSFTFTHGNAAEADLGSVVGYHKGLLKSVSSYANVTIEAGDITQITALGGLVGRITVGTVDGCDYAGNITIPSGFSVTGKLTHIGGLVGEITNAAGVIKNSYFYGTLETEARVSTTSKTEPYLFVGGIVGSVAAGTVQNCNVTANTTKEVTMANSTAYTGTLINHTTLAYHMAQGGIAGQNAGTVDNCSNLATTQNFVLTTGTNGSASDDNSRYYYLGGIVGLNKAGATVSDCVNEGLIESRSTPRIQKVGGVVGYNLGTVSSCSNEANISFPTSNISPYNMRVGEVGGVIGNNGGTVSEISNSGNITLSRSENNASVELKFGGVIGLTTTAINGGGSKSISNTGNILDSYSGATVTTAGLRFGGVVGSAQASVQNVTNSGSVTYQLYTAAVMSKLYMGGIVGELCNGANAIISGCENSGEVYFNVNSKNAAHTGDYVGGIVGYIHCDDDLTATVSDNENSGYVHIACTSTTASSDLVVGGVIGKMAENGTVSNCNNVGGASNAGEVALTFSNAAHTDNYAGGIIGKASGVNLAISECDNSGYIHGGNSNKQNGTTMYVGGIVAYLDGNSSIDDCDNTGKLLNDQFNNTNTKVGSTFEGGIAGFVVGTDANRITISNVTNNFNSGATITGGRRGFTGGAVGYGEYVDISYATNANSFGSGSGYWIGGIAGWLVNGTISGSTYSGISIESSQVQGAGGIVCTLDAGSTIDGCSSYLNSITHGANACVDGDIAAKSVAGSKIQNSHYTDTYGICSDTNFTDGGGNVADL